MDRSATAKMQALADVLGDLDPLTSALSLRIFITICVMSDEHKGVNMKDVEKRLDLHSSTLSRNVQALSARHRSGKGEGLLEALPDPTDARAKLVYLTARGRRMWARMKQACDDAGQARSVS